MTDDPWTGATGRFPRGMLDANDEGELQLAVGQRDNVITVNFGKPVAWLGLGPAEARSLAEMLLRRADLVDATPRETLPKHTFAMEAKDVLKAIKLAGINTPPGVPKMELVGGVLRLLWYRGEEEG